MAYASLVSLAQTTDKVLNHSQYSLSVHEKQHILAIHEYAIFIQAFLEYFPERAINFEGRFRELANQAEDVLVNLMLEQIRSLYGALSEYYQSGRYEQQVRRVAEEIDSIAGEVMEIKDSFRIEGVQVSVDSSAASGSSSSRLAFTSKDVMVGFDEDLMAIKTRLCGESSKLQFLPIVGMGGIGKTTLARNAYDDPYVIEYFDVRAWVTISQYYTAKGILSDLLASMKVKESSGPENDEEKVYKGLKGWRYLIVVDDIWNTEAWDVVRDLFPDDNNGSRILLTTRLSYVAAYPDSSSSCHQMSFMDVDQSWNLLRQRVFVDQDCPPDVVDTGRMISGNCKGLPLAIVAVAGFLSRVSKTRSSWEEIATKVKSAVTAEHGHIDEILLLSYAHLPHHLRPCFLYLGGFREDSEVRVSKLIKLWVAEGFLEHKDRMKSLEDEAEEYLEDLVKRNLVLVTKRKFNGKIKSCSLHDMMRDLCIRKSKEEKFFEDLMDEGRCTDHRRIAITSDDLPHLLRIDRSSIHTIIIYSWSSRVKLDFVTSVRLLRVLDSRHPLLEGLPAQLFELFHLRYLSIDSVTRKIPTAISNFQSLQTLIITENGCWMPTLVHHNYLPQEIWRLQQLRHLLFCGRLRDPKGETWALDKLQTLSLVSHYNCSEETLKMIPNVKKLGVCCSDYQGGTYPNNLVHLHQLENLSLYSRGKLYFCKDDFTFPNVKCSRPKTST